MSDGPGRQPSVTDAEILEVFKQVDDPVLTTSEVAEAVEMGRRGMFDRLQTLEKDGLLKSKKVGGRGAVWWYPGYTETPSLE